MASFGVSNMVKHLKNYQVLHAPYLKRSTKIVVVIEFLVLEDQSSLVEAVLSGWRRNMWKGCSSGRSRWWWWSIMVILAGK